MVAHAVFGNVDEAPTTTTDSAMTIVMAVTVA
jgi:hypothetical protein